MTERETPAPHGPCTRNFQTLNPRAPVFVPQRLAIQQASVSVPYGGQRSSLLQQSSAAEVLGTEAATSFRDLPDEVRWVQGRWLGFYC